MRRSLHAVGLCSLAALSLFVAGCGSNGPPTGEVYGTITVDGAEPPAGSSITFIPTDGHSTTGGATLEKGKYSVKMAVGSAKVQIRAPKPSKKAGPKQGGPGPGGAGLIEESLPAKYNDKTELTFDVQPGRHEKNWDLTTSGK